MAGFKGQNFNDRREAAAKARAALAERFAAHDVNDPDLQKRLAERKVVADARAERQAERAAAKAAELARAEAERRAAEAERVRQEAELKAAQKAARDARYARRKAKK
jgi:hypothetical protein